jgi:hypothetical protein
LKDKAEDEDPQVDEDKPEVILESSWILKPEDVDIPNYRNGIKEHEKTNTNNATDVDKNEADIA